MKPYKFFALIVLFAMLLAACAPVTPGAVVETEVPPTSSPLPPTPAENQQPVPEAVQAAQQMLAERLGISVEEIQIREIEQTQWPDGCLGLGGPAESCLMAVVDGYRVVFEVNGQSYVYRTDLTGEQVRAEDGGEQAVPEAVLVAQRMLAERLGVPVEEIQVGEVVQTQWPDGCLGLGGPAESCLAALVDGYRVEFEVNGQTYVYRTDMEGQQARAEESEGQPGGELPGTQQPVDEANLPGGALSAHQVLAQQLGLDLDQIKVISVEQVDWPNSCLGVQKAGQMCAMMITPGYRIFFEVDGKRYEYHTDLEGGSVIQAMAPIPQMSQQLIVWEQTESGVCSRAEISQEEVSFGSCDGRMAEGRLQPERLEELLVLATTYKDFMVGTPAGTLEFNGEGQQVATEAEQRSIAEWSRLVFQEAESGRSGASWGMVFAWHQEGGIAGLCSDVTLYTTGWYFATSCKGAQPEDLGHFRLTAEQLAQVYEWVDQYAGFEYEFTDPAVADAMTTRMVFSGKGTRQPSTAEQEEILQFAAELFAQAPR